MDLLPIIFLLAIFGFAFLNFKKPRLQLKKLKAGELGEFSVDCHFNFDEIIIAVDRKRRLLYLIDIRIPQFDRYDEITSFMDGSFRCRFEDITSIHSTKVSNKGLAIDINFDENFKLNGFKQKWKSLRVITNMNAEFTEFKNELSSIPFSTHETNKG